jgi:plastocyanin
MRLKRYLTIILIGTMAGCGGGGAAYSTGTGGGDGTPAASFASLNLSPASGTVTVGGSFQLTATPMDPTGIALTGLPASTFQSSDPAKATVNANGLVTGVAAGSVTITATLTNAGTTRTATTNLTVTQPAPAQSFTSLAVTPEVGTVAVGGTLALTATPRDQNGAAMAGLPAAAWSLSDPAKAGISAGTLTGIAPGALTVTASVTAGGVTRTASASVTVTQPATPTAPTSAVVQGIEDAFSPSAVTIATGGTVTWTMLDEEHDVTWSGAAPAGGGIPRMDKGSSATRSFATAGTYSYACSRHNGRHGGTVTVNAGGGGSVTPVFTSLTLTPGAPAVQADGTVQLTATPRDQNGAAMAGLPAATFQSSDATRATVSATGLVTAVAVGTATITATVTANGATRTAASTVTVTSTAPPAQPSGATVATPNATFSPAVVTIAAGGSVTWQVSGARHNVTFSGAAPTGGNVPDTDAGGSATRTFPNAGTYDYVCTRHSGMQGRVVAQ